MMKKHFLIFLMVTLGLFAGVNTVWAVDPVPETDYYWAKLTARPSTGTGGSGKLYVSSAQIQQSDVPEWGSTWTAANSAEEYVMVGDGARVNLYAYAQADAGSYFAGWSETDGGIEKGLTSPLIQGCDLSTQRGIANAMKHTIYATFEPIRIVSYSIEGDGSTSANKCSFEVYFQPDATIALTDFENPVVTKKDGTAVTWTAPTTGKKKWSISEEGKLKVLVNFDAGSSDPGEFTATLTVTTKAGISIDVPLYARTITASPGAAALYDGNTQMTSGTVAEMLAVNTSAYEKPVLKLLGDCSDAIAIDKNLTLDLNGFALNNNLTVSAGDVALAYSPYGGILNNNVSVAGGKLTLVGGTITGNVTVSAGATLEQNGAAITGTVTNAGTMTTTDGSITGQLASGGTLTLNGGTFTNESGAAIVVSNGTAAINKGSISGSTYGVQTTGGTTTIEKLAAVSGSTKALNGAGGTLTVNNGKFTSPNTLADGTITFVSAYFQENNDLTSFEGKQVWRNTAGAAYREGYVYFAGDQAAAQASGVSVCRINTTSYSSLEDALAYANNNPSKKLTIFMENDYTLPAGYYTIPANATLVVPMSNDQESANASVPRVPLEESESYPTPYAFRRLTLASGANINVMGVLEVTCPQYCKSGQQVMSFPGGAYGHLVLKPGSHITLSSGAELRAWGYVTGDGTRDANGTYLSGEIDARRGSIVHEQFQLGDWKGGNVSFTMIKDDSPQNKTHLFPIYEYFIQNVEAPVKYHPGSFLECATSVTVQGNVKAYANAIKVVGTTSNSMFYMDEMADAENTWVRKWYDANKDQQVYEVNSGAKLGSMVIDLGEIDGALIGMTGKQHIQMNSQKFILPLTNNMKIHLLSGLMQFTQSTVCLPGMEVEVDKESEIQIIASDDPNTVSGALYFYDSEQWGRYVQSGKYGTIAQYSATLDAKPAVRDVSSAAALGDAKLIVHGTFRVGEHCAVYTTVGKTQSGDEYTQDLTKGGANIVSTNEDAGTFIFDAAAPTTTGVTIHDGMFVWNAQGQLNPEVLVNYDNSENGLAIGTVLDPETPKPIYGFELCTSARLKNGNGEFADTEGTAAGKSYCYMNDQWTLMDVADDNDCFMKDNYGTFYAKPAEYVAVVAAYDNVEGVVKGNEDHTYSDKAGAGRLFILMDGCQWWEVEKKDNLYHCIHPNNDTYYYWDDSDADESKHHWAEQRFTITWKNWNGEEIKSYTYDPVTGEPAEVVAYSVTYGTMAEYLGSNPTREANIDYTYDFTGWSPELGPVTGNVTYTATYKEKPRMYTIVFQNEGGTEIERHFLTHNEVPVCENVPTRAGFTLQWEPAIAAVTKDAVYRATWLENPPTEYEITFFDYNGTTELQKGDVAVGSMPTPPANPANKPATSEFTYVFDHWSPALEEVSATSAKSYTAVYSEVAKTYTVIFQDQNGDEIERHDYAYGETPVCENMPTMANTAQYTYSFAWTPQIQTVMADATYQAVFTPTTNKYTVTLQCNLPGACTFTGAGIYDYGTSTSVAANPADGYVFVKWQEREGDANLGSVTIEGDITLTAVVKETAKADPEDMVIGMNDTRTVASATDVMDLTLTSDGMSQSGQIENANNITLYGNADFVMEQSFANRTWYCVAVPWRVEANGGIYLNGSSTPAELGTDIEICYYDGSVRAAQGKVSACWVYMKNLSTKKILEPGRAYMIALLNTSATQITFRKKAQEPLLTTTVSVNQYNSFVATDANWNAIANPSLMHSYLNVGSDEAKAQYYIPEEDRYDWFYLNAEALVVGEPAYVQAPTTTTVTASASYAPRRAKAEASEATFDVQITAEGATKRADHLSIQINENKENDEYTIGQDLVKFGVSTKVAQMWIDRYDSKLCANTVVPEEEATSFPMSIFAPKAGSYTIAIEREKDAEDYALYLTYNGEAIWNLSDGAYVANLQQGTDNKYGLRVSARVPQVVTGVDEAIVDAQGDTRKVLINNQVFIIRGEKVYTIDGQLVK